MPGAKSLSTKVAVIEERIENNRKQCESRDSSLSTDIDGVGTRADNQCEEYHAGMLHLGSKINKFEKFLLIQIIGILIGLLAIFLTFFLNNAHIVMGVVK